MSAGLQAAGVTPVGQEPTQTTPVLPLLASSRSIDGKRRAYVLDGDTDSYAAMDDTAQRVLLLLAFRVVEPGIMTDSFEATMEQRIRAALVPVTRGPEPAARIERVVVTRSNNGSRVSVTYRNLLTGTRQTVKG